MKKKTYGAYSLSDIIIACDQTGETQCLRSKTLYAETDRLLTNVDLCEIEYQALVVKDYGD